MECLIVGVVLCLAAAVVGGERLIESLRIGCAILLLIVGLPLVGFITLLMMAQ